MINMTTQKITQKIRLIKSPSMEEKIEVLAINGGTLEISARRNSSLNPSKRRRNLILLLNPNSAKSTMKPSSPTKLP